jgi:hypothetical protein
MLMASIVVRQSCLVMHDIMAGASKIRVNQRLALF